MNITTEQVLAAVLNMSDYATYVLDAAAKLKIELEEAKKEIVRLQGLYMTKTTEMQQEIDAQHKELLTLYQEENVDTKRLILLGTCALQVSQQNGDFTQLQYPPGDVVSLRKFVDIHLNPESAIINY